MQVAGRACLDEPGWTRAESRAGAALRGGVLWVSLPSLGRVIVLLLVKVNAVWRTLYRASLRWFSNG